MRKIIYLSCFFLVFFAVAVVEIQAKSREKYDSRALDIVQTGLSDESYDIRIAAIDTIINFRNPEYIPVIKKMLDDKNDFVKIEAAVALYKMGDSTGVPELRRLLKEKPNLTGKVNPLLRAKAIAKGTVRMKAAKALADIKDQGSLPILREMLDDDDGRVVDAALIALAKMGDESSAKDFRSAIRSTKPEVRAKAAEALGDLRDVKSLPDLRERLKDWHVETKAAVLIALGKLKDKQSEPRIRVLLKDKDPIVREKAAVSLGMIGDRECADDLKKVLEEDPNGFVRIAASAALFEMTDYSGKDFLIKTLKSNDKDAKLGALEALSKIINDSDQDKIAPLLDDPDKLVALKAAKTIFSANQRDIR